MNRNKKLFVLIACLLILLVGCTAEKTAQKSVESTPSTEEATLQTKVPTLFIHGYKGGNGTFGGLLKRLNQTTVKELILTVSSTGTVQATGQLTGKANNPSVQVIFEDNKNNEWNQAEWLKNCLHFLNEHYGVKEVNLVGHSMGGVSSLRYLTTYGAERSLPQVKKFVSIAAPFNDLLELSPGETLENLLEAGPVVQSDRYTDLANNLAQVPTTVQVLMIAGDLQDGSLSDGTVPVADALSMVALLKKHGNPVTEKVFYGKKAQHSQLHENPAVDRSITEFLWETEPTSK